jgi:hypothetical protein
MKKIFARMSSPDGLARPALSPAGLVLAVSRSPPTSREPLDRWPTVGYADEAISADLVRGEGLLGMR